MVLWEGFCLVVVPDELIANIRGEFQNLDGPTNIDQPNGLGIHVCHGCGPVAFFWGSFSSSHLKNRESLYWVYKTLRNGLMTIPTIGKQWEFRSQHKWFVNSLGKLLINGIY